MHLWNSNRYMEGKISLNNLRGEKNTKLDRFLSKLLSIFNMLILSINIKFNMLTCESQRGAVVQSISLTHMATETSFALGALSTTPYPLPRLEQVTHPAEVDWTRQIQNESQFK